MKLSISFFGLLLLSSCCGQSSMYAGYRNILTNRNVIRSNLTPLPDTTLRHYNKIEAYSDFMIIPLEDIEVSWYYRHPVLRSSKPN